jgi:hypothetical protein
LKSSTNINQSSSTGTLPTIVIFLIAHIVIKVALRTVHRLLRLMRFAVNLKMLGLAAAWNCVYCSLMLSTSVAFVPSRRLLTRQEKSSPISLIQPSNVISTRRFAVSVQEKNNLVEDVESSAIWEQLNIAEGNLALGVKPEEVLKYIGT